MKLTKSKGATKKTGASIGFKTSIRGRKWLRKQKRLQKKQNRAVFAARLQRLHVGAKGSPVTKSNKIKQLRTLIEAEKARLKEGEATEALGKTVKANGKSPETEEQKPEEDGFQPSSASKEERMTRLQEFVNQEAGISESQTMKPRDTDVLKDDEKPNLIKDKKKLQLLRDEQKEDTKEINKMARLLRMNKPQKKKVAPIFAEDFGGLLQDIEEGSMSHAEKYKTEEKIDEGNRNSDEEFERDVATALGRDVSEKKMKKGKASEAVVEDKGKKIKKGLSAGKEDPENEFRESDFNLYVGGDLSDDEKYDDMYEDDDAYEDGSYSERRKFGRSGSASQEYGEESEYIDGENEEGADESKFSSDDEEGGYGNVICSADDAGLDSEISDEEEVEFTDGYDLSKFSDSEDEGEDDIASKFSDVDYSDNDGDESKLSGHEIGEEEEEEDEDGFFDMEAEEDSEADKESDGEGELIHDFREEPEYAFQGGSGYYNKPEILKNGMENDIDRYSSNSEDDVDLEGFVVNDDEVKYEDVSDELPPDELSDSPSPIRKRKKVRIIVQSDDESDGKRSDRDENGKEVEEKDGGYFCPRGIKSERQEDEDGRESLGAKSGSKDQAKEQDTSSDESCVVMSENAPKKRKMNVKEEKPDVKRRKLVSEDESSVESFSVEKTKPKTTGQENEGSPHVTTSRISLDKDLGDVSRAQSENVLQILSKKIKEKRKLDENSEETSTLDSLDVLLVKPEKKLEDGNDADVSTMDSVDVTLGKSRKKKKKLDNIIEDDSTVDNEDSLQSKTKKKKKKVGGEDKEDDSTAGNEDSSQSKKKKKLGGENKEDDSTVDNEDSSQIMTKKKKKKLGGEDKEDDSAADNEDSSQIKKKKKLGGENKECDSTADNEDSSQSKTKKKKKKQLGGENKEDDSTVDNEDFSQIKAKKKKKKLGESKEDDFTVKTKKIEIEEENEEDTSTVDTENASQTKIKKTKKTEEVVFSEQVSQTTTKKKKNLEDKNAGDLSTVDSEDAAKTETKVKKKKKTQEGGSTVESGEELQAKTKTKELKLNSDNTLTHNTEDIPQITTKTKKRKLDEDDDGDAPRLKSKKKKKRSEEEGDVLAPESKAKSEEALQKLAKGSGEGSDASLHKPTYTSQSEEEKTAGKPVSRRKLMALPEISTGEEEEEEEEEEEGEVEEGEEEEEEEDNDNEEEEGYMEEEEEEEDIEEVEYVDEEEEEEEEGDMEEEGEEEEEEEEEEDMDEYMDDEDEREQEEEADEGNISTKRKTSDNTTQREAGDAAEDALTEDIYGRLRDKHGNVVTPREPRNAGESSRYVPPALRKLAALNLSREKEEKLAALRRTLKGLINRLAESNMGGIASEIEATYSRHARNDVNEMLAELLVEAVVGPALTPERLVQELALLVALLSANVGSEVGAHVLNEFVLMWSDEVDGFSPEAKGGSKEPNNLLLFIAHLYAFRVVEARLMYDLLHRLARGFSEKEVELILLALRSVGFNLRKDDPLALKALIAEIQTRAARVQEKDRAAAGSSREAAGTEYSRVTFMMEAVQALRNNNVSKLPNCDPTHVEHLRQVLRGLVRKGRQPARLNVTLEDMLKARERGRWWVVGSAWSGGLVGQQTDRETEAKTKKSHTQASDAEFSDAFMRKAAKLQLSRPPRVNILYIVTEGSEDYLDAFEKLLQLSLPQKQERELFGVILLCCQKGKLYNPFFSYLADRMCKFDRKYARLLQFALWDKFEEVEAMKMREVSNLAKFLTHLIGEDSLNLTLFKKVSFMDAGKQTISLVRQVLIALLLHPEGSDAVERTFSVLSTSPKLRVLRQSLRIFILKFIKAKKSSKDTSLAMLSRRVETAMQILTRGSGVSL